MDTLMKILNELVPILGQVGVDALVDELNELTEGMDDAWKKMVMNLVVNAVENHGMEGIQLALGYINALMEGERIPEIDWADLRTASDVVAHLQNAEADRKSEVNDFMAKISAVLGKIVAGLLKGLLSN